MNQEKTPLVSIWMPVRNATPLIERALQSCANQTYKNLEVVVFNDASTDNTREMVQSFSGRDPRIKLIQNNERLGLVRSMPAAIQHTSGDVVQILSHDDWLARDYIETTLRTFQNCPEAAVVVARIIHVCENEKKISYLNEPETGEGKYPASFYAKHGYKSFLHSAITLGLMRREDALDAAMFMRNLLDNVPESLPEELREMVKYEYGSDVMFPTRVAAKRKYFVVTKKTAYIKDTQPDEHYMAHKGSMKLRAEYGLLDNTAKKIFKHLYFVRKLYEYSFAENFPDYFSYMRRFYGREAIATVCIKFLRNPLRLGFWKEFKPKDMAIFFKGYSLKDVIFSVLLVPARFLERLFQWLKRKGVSKEKIDIRQPKYFLNKEGKFSV